MAYSVGCDVIPADEVSRRVHERGEEHGGARPGFARDGREHRPAQKRLLDQSDPDAAHEAHQRDGGERRSLDHHIRRAIPEGQVRP